jgi:hypothetical protein
MPSYNKTYLGFLCMICLLYNGLLTYIFIIHSYRNAGDAALAATAYQQLHEAFPDFTVTQSINEPYSYLENDLGELNQSHPLYSYTARPHQPGTARI